MVLLLTQQRHAATVRGFAAHVERHHPTPAEELCLNANIPAWRYPEMAVRVREICERHGLPYRTGSLRSQFTSAMRRLVRFALPSERSHAWASATGAVIRGLQVSTIPLRKVDGGPPRDGPRTARSLVVS